MVRKAIYAKLPRPMQVLMTFVLVMLGWVFFRSASISDAWRFLTIMFTPSSALGGSILLSAEIYNRGRLIVMAICALLVFQRLQAFDWVKTITWSKAVTLIILFCLSLMAMFAQSFRSFLYFQF